MKKAILFLLAAITISTANAQNNFGTSTLDGYEHIFGADPDFPWTKPVLSYNWNPTYYRFYVDSIQFTNSILKTSLTSSYSILSVNDNGWVTRTPYTAFTIPLSQTTGRSSTLIPEGTNLYYTDARARAAISITTLTANAASYNSSTGVINVPPAPGTNNFTSYSDGTVYNLTTTPARLDFGTTDPVVTLTTAGTYEITSNVRIDYSGLTNDAANTVTVKLRRTNNTAADLTNATGDFIVPPVTLLTATGGDCDVNRIIYTTSNNNDVIELWGSRSGSISVGNIQAGNAWIVATRIY